jgi:hypothetical protein
MAISSCLDDSVAVYIQRCLETGRAGHAKEVGVRNPIGKRASALPDLSIYSENFISQTS